MHFNLSYDRTYVIGHVMKIFRFVLQFQFSQIHFLLHLCGRFLEGQIRGSTLILRSVAMGNVHFYMGLDLGSSVPNTGPWLRHWFSVTKEKINKLTKAKTKTSDICGFQNPKRYQMRLPISPTSTSLFKSKSSLVSCGVSSFVRLLFSTICFALEVATC